jgi:hypothetical protein
VSLRRQSVRAAIVLAALLAGGPVSAQQKVHIIAVGDINRLEIGQQGYCGTKTVVPYKLFQQVYVDSGERVYVDVLEKLGRYECMGEFSFVPHAPNTYVIRSAVRGFICHFEVFRAAPGEKPVQESEVQNEPRRSCF